MLPVVANVSYFIKEDLPFIYRETIVMNSESSILLPSLASYLSSA